MAGDSKNADDRPEGSHGPRECMPCRGTGNVISSLGGSPSTVTCPWCGGSGIRVPGTDAQAGWPPNEPPAPPAPEPAAADQPAAGGESSAE